MLKLQALVASLEDPRVAYALLRLFAEPPRARPRRPANLAVVLDRSSSMRGPRLFQACRALRQLVERLDERDRLSVVGFDASPRVLLPPGPVTAEARARLLSSLDELRTGAGTNLAAGWKKGCELVASGFVREAVSRVVLLTDGRPSVGPTTVEELGAFAEEQAARGVATTAMGIGEGFDDRLLAELARRGKGGFYYLATAEAIPAAFGRELAGVFAIAATSVEVKLLPEPEVTACELLHRVASRPAPDGLVVEVGEIAAEAPRQLLIRFVCEHAAAGRLLAKVAITSRDADGGAGPPQLDRVAAPAAPIAADTAEVALEHLRIATASALDEAWARRGSGKRREAIAALAEVRSAVAGARERGLAPAQALEGLIAELSEAERALASASHEAESLRRRARERSHVTLLGQSVVGSLPADED